MKDTKSKIGLLLSMICVSGCINTEGIRYDSNSDKYKRQHGIQREPARTGRTPKPTAFYK